MKGCMRNLCACSLTPLFFFGICTLLNAQDDLVLATDTACCDASSCDSCGTCDGCCCDPIGNWYDNTVLFLGSDAWKTPVDIDYSRLKFVWSESGGSRR